MFELVDSWVGSMYTPYIAYLVQGLRAQVSVTILDYVCTWAQDKRPAYLHMAQPNAPVSKAGHILDYLMRF
jgi:hypothetical protein